MILCTVPYQRWLLTDDDATKSRRVGVDETRNFIQIIVCEIQIEMHHSDDDIHRSYIHVHDDDDACAT